MKKGHRHATYKLCLILTFLLGIQFANFSIAHAAQKVKTLNQYLSILIELIGSGQSIDEFVLENRDMSEYAVNVLINTAKEDAEDGELWLTFNIFSFSDGALSLPQSFQKNEIKWYFREASLEGITSSDIEQQISTAFDIWKYEMPSQYTFIQVESESNADIAIYLTTDKWDFGYTRFDWSALGKTIQINTGLRKIFINNSRYFYTYVADHWSNEAYTCWLYGEENAHKCGYFPYAIAHEIGHTLGLPDAPDKWNSTDLMGYAAQYQCELKNWDKEQLHKLYGEPEYSKIVYTGSDGLYLIDIDGSNNRKILNISGYVGSPKLSPDGSKVIYLYGDIYLINVDGSGKETIYSTIPDYECATIQGADFHPNGESAVFALNDCDNPTTWIGKFYSINLSTKEMSLLTTLTGHAGFAPDVDPIIRYPEYSPDGSSIIFDYLGDIYIMDSNGNNQRFLVSDAFHGAFHPNGNNIIFNRFKEVNYILYHITYKYDLTTNRESILIDEWSAFPNYSKDGTKIVFGTPGSIYIINADGSGGKKTIAQGFEPSF